MPLDDLDIYVLLAKSIEGGMIVQEYIEIPEIPIAEIERMINYYSPIIGFSKKQNHLFGPLPFTNHHDYLFYLYSFCITDPTVESLDNTTTQEEMLASLIVIFPTKSDALARNTRENIIQKIRNWINSCDTINNFDKEKLMTIRNEIKEEFIQEKSIKIVEKQKDTIIAIGRNLQLLETVALSFNKELNLLITGTSKVIFTITRQALHQCSESIKQFKLEENKIFVDFSRLKLAIIHLTKNDPSVMEYVNEDLNGLLYFADFSTDKTINYHTDELNKILKATLEECIICYAFCENKEPIRINETKIPEILLNAKGRTISLIDLAQASNSIELAIIEFAEHLIDSFK